MGTLRGIQIPELSKLLYKMIKTENHAIDSYESAGRDRTLVASQLADWGESTGDPAISDLSDKLGVLLAEIGEQEDVFAHMLEEARNLLKHIRNTEGSVQPAREHKAKIIDEIQKQKQRDPEGPKVTTLEQELVRAEARALVAEAQLTNMTRQKFKESFDMHLAATIERCEKQIVCARHGRRLLSLLDDTPLVPGETRGQWYQSEVGRQIIDDAELELRGWEPTSIEPIPMASGSSVNRGRGHINGDGINGENDDGSTYQKDEIEV
ncbi:hypothetical protein FQN57_006186 [Myotisia sp. PD_48]|nr:hypothetical protein FQN57_006186 [Myotisia sp. PD_48]